MPAVTDLVPFGPFTVTFADGMTAPDSSVTMPRRVVVCAMSEVARTKINERAGFIAVRRTRRIAVLGYRIQAEP